jgi:hypothetical protein
MVEIKCLELEDELVEQGLNQEEIDEKVDVLRKVILLLTRIYYRI